jgi:hypothetical protein
VNQHLTPDEVEVGRRNLIAELKGLGERASDEVPVVRLDLQTIRDLIAVLEASKPAVVAPECSGCYIPTEEDVEEQGGKFTDIDPSCPVHHLPTVVDRTAAIQALVAASSRTERVLGREFVEGWADTFAEAIASTPPVVDREALGEAWDDGNATGLDGYVGPNRGAGDVDAEAELARERVLNKLTAAPTALYPKATEGKS